jgi:hypothetical protein
MGVQAYQFELASMCHPGVGRRGMVAYIHRFIPGHVISFGLAVALAKLRCPKGQGVKFEDFESALSMIQKSWRVGPAFLLRDNEALLPEKDKSLIEVTSIHSRNQVALDFETKSGIDGALFELEAHQSTLLSGEHKGESAVWGCVVWGDEALEEGITFNALLEKALLGGELTKGMGRIKKVSKVSQERYFGYGKLSEEGLHLEANSIVPGAMLARQDGSVNAVERPWVGRRFDRQKGFGRSSSNVVFVQMDANTARPMTLRPSSDLETLGLWEAD